MLLLDNVWTVTDLASVFAASSIPGNSLSCLIVNSRPANLELFTAKSHVRRHISVDVVNVLDVIKKSTRRSKSSAYCQSMPGCL